MGILRKTALILATIGGLVISTGSVHASDYNQPRYYYKTVTAYQTVQKPVVRYVTKYDHCGNPYRAKVVTYKLVQIPVQKQVKVCY